MPVNQDLLDILVCPETKQPVKLADDELLSKINQKIEAGSLRNRGGDTVSSAIQEGLLREDGRHLTPAGTKHFPVECLHSPISGWLQKIKTAGDPANADAPTDSLIPEG